MTLGLALKVAGALVALAWGVWMGRAGRYRQSVEEIEKVMDAGGGRRRPSKRAFTPLSWLTRSADKGTSRPSRGARRFQLEAPKDR